MREGWADARDRKCTGRFAEARQHAAVLHGLFHPPHTAEILYIVTDVEFHKLTARVAERIGGRTASRVLSQYKDWFDEILPHADKSNAVIKSSVWGWSIECQVCCRLDTAIIVTPEYFKAHSWCHIIAEFIVSLDEAIILCDTLGLKYTIRDTGDPDPL